MMLSNWKLAKEGWNNLKTIGEDGWDGLKDVLTPSKEDVLRQIKDVNPTPEVKWSEVPSTVVTTVTDTVSKTKYGKYVKYALIGGAALLVVRILKK